MYTYSIYYTLYIDIIWYLYVNISLRGEYNVAATEVNELWMAEVTLALLQLDFFSGTLSGVWATRRLS